MPLRGNALLRGHGRFMIGDVARPGNALHWLYDKPLPGWCLHHRYSTPVHWIAFARLVRQ